MVTCPGVLCVSDMIYPAYRWTLSRSKRHLICIISASILLLIATWATINHLFNTVSPVTPRASRKASTTTTGPPLNANGTKIILAWNRFHENPTFGASGFGRSPFATCPVNNCVFTNDRAYTKTSNVVLFHVGQGWNLPDLKDRDPKQIYVFFSREAPTRTRKSSNLDRGRYAFNLTMTYRMDSDIPIPWGFTKERDDRLPVYKLRFPFANRTRSVAWLVSGCSATIRRWNYVKTLRRHIDVDIYGDCGIPACRGPRCTVVDIDIPSRYKFYLAFENSFCRDYITEKLFRTLSTEIVPVVFGSGNYSRYAPPHSVIDTADFKSPRELAIYLKYLARNETKYMAYMQWKKTHTIRIFRFSDAFCKLCEIANNQSFYKRYDIPQWWWEGMCSK